MATADITQDTPADTSAITADEIALYDRQIRLWGVQAQENIRKADILLISIKALGNEIAKNLVLAGIHSLTIVDHELVTENNLGSQFLLIDDDIGKNRAKAAAPRVRELNPRVQVHVDTSDIRTKIEDQSYISQFDIIIATDIDFATAQLLNTLCRMINKPFYAAGSHGFYGFIFADLITHDFVVEQDMPNIPTKPGKIESNTRLVLDVNVKEDGGKFRETVTRREQYTPLLLANTSPLPSTKTPADSRKRRKTTPVLSCLRALWDFERKFIRLPAHTPEDLRAFTSLATKKHTELGLPRETLNAEFLRKFLQNLGTEISPVTSIIGGLLAQDVINMLGKRQQPIQNFCLFDGDSFNVPVYSLHPHNFEDGSADTNGVAKATAGAEILLD